MGNRHKILGFILIGLFAFLLAACMGEQERRLQGNWAQGNVHYYAEWIFSEGRYAYSYTYTINTPNAYESGRYAVKESGDDYIVLELFDRTGRDPSLLEENERIRINFKTDEDSISIRNQTYWLVSDSSLGALQTSQAP